MTPEESRKLIEVAGGDKQFATLIGLAEEPGYKQRVNNWKRRGIPATVILANQSVIQDLAAKAQHAA
jgi:DNA-binding transcriptional regulator YdaS (Cro superfamily)